MPDAYEPQPIDASRVDLPPELGALGERLAEHVHDLWARGRRADGWTWGPRRDDARKETQNLVPYAQLTEEEKAYDRATAEGTLRAILALGFKITPPAPAGAITAAARAARQSVRSIQLAWNPPPMDPDASELEMEIAKEAHARSRDLRRIVAPPGSPELDEAVSHLSKAALDFGETFLASEIARAGLEEIRRQREASAHEHAPPDPRLNALDAKLRHRQALCQASLGNADEAERLIGEALELEPRNSDVIAALGRIAKDRALATASPAQRRELLRPGRSRNTGGRAGRRGIPASSPISASTSRPFCSGTGKKPTPASRPATRSRASPPLRRATGPRLRGPRRSSSWASGTRRSPATSGRGRSWGRAANGARCTSPAGRRGGTRRRWASPRRKSRTPSIFPFWSHSPAICRTGRTGRRRASRPRGTRRRRKRCGECCGS